MFRHLKPSPCTFCHWVCPQGYFVASPLCPFCLGCDKPCIIIIHLAWKENLKIQNQFTHVEPNHIVVDMLTLQYSQPSSFLYFNHYLMCRTIPAPSCGHNLNPRLQEEGKECFLFTLLACMFIFVGVMNSICRTTQINQFHTSQTSSTSHG